MNPIGQIRVNRRVVKTPMTPTKDIRNGFQNAIDAVPLKKGALTQGNTSHIPMSRTEKVSRSKCTNSSISELATPGQRRVRSLYLVLK